MPILGAHLYKNGFKVVDGDKPGPTFEATIVERMTIRRFLDFALKDLEFQTEALLKDRKLLPAQRQNHEISAALIMAYIKSLRGGVENMKESAPAPTDVA